MVLEEKRKGIMNEIETLFSKNGKGFYAGEAVTQFEHMSQAAYLAKENQESVEMITACFLHDIGHLLDENFEFVGYHPEAQNHLGNMCHELLVANLLRFWGFPELVVMPVLNHVKAKKYLVAVDAGYYESLSEASKATLAMQGGGMSRTEIIEFESSRYFEQSIRLRYYDDIAKVAGAQGLQLAELAEYIQQVFAKVL